ncbi:MAG: hypothetical protein IJM78_03690 [Prevotella sp.]|nr:hypothetical protein [Prevotella sp.]
MRKILAIGIFLLVAIGVEAQTLKRLKVYQKDTTTDTLYLAPEGTIAHSRFDLEGHKLKALKINFPGG